MRGLLAVVGLATLATAATLRQVWTTELPFIQRMTVADQGIVFAATESMIYGLNASTGVPLWLRPLSAVRQRPGVFLYAVPGTRDTVAFTLYYSALVRIDGATGNVVWTIPESALPGWTTAGASVAFQGDLLVIEGAATVLGIDVLTGTIRFARQYGMVCPAYLPSAMLSPSGVAVYLDFTNISDTLHNASLSAFSTTLNETLWTRPWPFNWSSTSAIYGVNSEVVLACRAPFDLVAVDIESGDALWTLPNASCCSLQCDASSSRLAPMVSIIDGTAFVFQGGVLHAIDAWSGDTLWVRDLFPGMGTGWTPLVRSTEGALLGISFDPNYGQSGVVRLSWSDGSALWSNATATALAPFNNQNPTFAGFVSVTTEPFAAPRNMCVLDAHTGAQVGNVPNVSLMASHERSVIVQAQPSGQTSGQTTLFSIVG
eukprot:CAMPEP_0174834462 /NCGR_PEP_ID=MMETSP1114-20130205/4839_1 /TAXON_ID=312471 /ORGANISM="Neobodo designis, Strain CCAP 1951/1" /LENGTH=428 /DNA_ID=CAMNT_0016068373 /DNA_START=48 /DNA_END=1334 /DNA_ORIENTATION=-